MDDDLLTQLEPEEAAYALAASSGNDGFVRLDTLEDLVLEDPSTYVGAKRILECEASVTALCYAPLSRVISFCFRGWCHQIVGPARRLPRCCRPSRRRRTSARRPATTGPWRTSGAPLHRVVLGKSN